MQVNEYIQNQEGTPEFKHAVMFEDPPPCLLPQSADASEYDTENMRDEENNPFPSTENAEEVIPYLDQLGLVF